MKSQNLTKETVAKMICGMDGITYRNMCDLRQKSCKIGKMIPMLHQGPCTGKFGICKFVFTLVRHAKLSKEITNLFIDKEREMIDIRSLPTRLNIRYFHSIFVNCSWQYLNTGMLHEMHFFTHKINKISSSTVHRPFKVISSFTIQCLRN